MFKTREEVEAYLNQEKLNCLICGKVCKRLSLHIRQHNLKAREYKEKFGLPVGKGIDGALWCERAKNEALRRDFGKINPIAPPVGKASGVYRPPYWWDESKEKIADINERGINNVR